MDAFLKTCCVPAPHYAVERARLYAPYVHYCRVELGAGTRALGRSAFGKRLREYGYGGDDDVDTCSWTVDAGVYQPARARLKRTRRLRQQS